MRFRALIVAVLLTCVVGCTEGESGRFAPPQFVSVAAEIINGEEVQLRGMLSDGRAESCGFLYGKDGILDRRVEAILSNNSFEVLISDADCDIVYSWCAWASSGTAEITSGIGTFRIEPKESPEEPARPEPPEEPEDPENPETPDEPKDPEDPNPETTEFPPSDEIWYTTVTGKPTADVKMNLCVGCSVISNTYADGRGILKFDGTVSLFKEWAFYGNNDLESIILPSSVVNTTYSCFRQCVYLQSISFAPGLVILGDTSLHRNEKMTKVLLPDTVVSIEKDALSHCYSLTTIDLPPKLETLGQSAFLLCKKLESIVLPETMTKIGPYAFMNDTSLKSITCKAPNPPAGGYQMFDDTANCPIYVPAASVDAYRKAPYWSNYSQRIQPIPADRQMN